MYIVERDMNRDIEIMADIQYQNVWERYHYNQETFTEMLAILRISPVRAENDGDVYKCKGSNSDLYDPEVIYRAEAAVKVEVVNAIEPR